MPEQTEFQLLPTGKPHVSFSEVKLWKECSYRHFLTHVKKISIFKPSPVLAFGTAIHSAAEKYLLTREMNQQICFDILDKSWVENNTNEDFTPKALIEAKEAAELILTEFPIFFDKQFTGWEIIDAEHQLYENIEGHKNAFKGFIDGIIKVKDKNGDDIYWVLDHKTSARGWFRDKRSDEMIKSQLALYKNYWCQKNPTIPFKNVRCGFVILKKKAPAGDHCELFTVSLGDVPIKRALKVVSNMITSVKKGVNIKNRDACKWCEFYKTEHCV